MAKLVTFVFTVTDESGVFKEYAVSEEEFADLDEIITSINSGVGFTCAEDESGDLKLSSGNRGSNAHINMYYYSFIDTVTEEETEVVTELVEYQGDDGGTTGYPNDIARERIYETPYQILVEEIGEIDEEDIDPEQSTDGFILSFVRKPNNSCLDRRLYTHGEGESFKPRGRLGFSPTCRITENIVTEIETTVIVTDILGTPEVGWLGYLNDEIILVEAYNSSTKELTFARGMLDTVPQFHDQYSIIFFDILDIRHSDGRSYLFGETVQAKNCPRTSQGELPHTQANAHSVIMNARAIRPLPPGNINLKTCRHPNFITGELGPLSWSDRDRIQQTVYYVKQDEADIGPETDVTYELHILGEGIDVTYTSSDPEIATNSFSLTLEEEIILSSLDRPSDFFEITLKSVRGSYDSFQSQYLEIECAGYGMLYGDYYGVDDSCGLRVA